MAGCYLSADIFARYHRLRGNQVLMVSGSDTHGTPITIRADQEGITPAEVVDRYHALFPRIVGEAGNFLRPVHPHQYRQSRGGNPRHFQDAAGKGAISTLTIRCWPTVEHVSRFLPDRYVEGRLPPLRQHPAPGGDQCDACGRTLDPQDLVEPRCALSGDTPEFRESEHFFLRLSAFQNPLLEWVSKQTHWRNNVLNFTRRYLEDGLHDRAISRDLDWGVSIPLEGYEHKKIYVWFEAVIGYLSAGSGMGTDPRRT